MFSGIHLLAVALLLTPSALRAGEDTRPAQQPFNDLVFVIKAGSGGIYELELGKLAAFRAKNEDVKKFAEQMVTDLGKANEQLRTAANAAGLTVPDRMNDEHQKEFDRLKDYKGENFDREYVSYMIADHTASVAEFNRASKEAKHPAIQDFAAKTLPIIQAHLAAAKKLQPRD